jgi:hypothetical protein
VLKSNYVRGHRAVAQNLQLHDALQDRGPALFRGGDNFSTSNSRPCHCARPRRPKLTLLGDGLQRLNHVKHLNVLLLRQCLDVRKRGHRLAFVSTTLVTSSILEATFAAPSVPQPIEGRQHHRGLRHKHDAEAKLNHAVVRGLVDIEARGQQGSVEEQPCTRSSSCRAKPATSQCAP